MKFKIKYADQIVGALTIAAICMLVGLIFLLGSKQRWFSRDYLFYTPFDSASGLSAGMPIQYKGFTVGKVKSVDLNEDDRVIVTFKIYNNYYSRVHKGSLIELITSPIGLGTQLLFYPGLGSDMIVEGDEIPNASSDEGKQLVEDGLAVIPKRDDTISNLIAQVNPLLTNINTTLTDLNGAFNGKGKGPLANTLKNLDGISTTLDAQLGDLLANVTQMTGNLAQLSNGLSDPTGLVPKLIDPDGKIFGSVQKSLDSISATMANLEGSSQILRTQMPELASLIQQIDVAVVKGQDVLDGLRNNPLLKGGIPTQKQTEVSGSNVQGVEF